MRPFTQLFLLFSLFLTSCSTAQKLPAVEEQSFDTICINLINQSLEWSPEVEQLLADKWETGSVPFVLEMTRLTRGPFIADLYKMMEKKTGQSFGLDDSAWQNWLWKQDYKPLARYPEFKAQLYKNIDPRFEEYFKNDAKSTIRLDQVVWGGVRKDGIPPLRGPEMISAEKATYLGDNDIVFGIEINGDARAYPKRILAWHEMFTDTIQGVPLAGVY